MTTSFGDGGGSWDGWSQPRLEDLAGRLGELAIRRGKARGRCPVCESATGCWALVTEAGEARVGCFSCDGWRDLRAMAGLDGEPRTRPRFLPPATRGPKALDMVADAAVLDAVYRALLKHLPMTADQRRNVLGRDRGISAPVRERMSPLMGPVPRDPGTWRGLHARILDDLRRVAPAEELRRVPELAAREGGSFAILPTRRGAQYFEPWRDEEGRVVALRAYMGKRTDGRKYLVTYGRSGPMVHFAFGVPREQIERAPWVFTEGWMKAEVSAHSLGAVGVGLPGVQARNAWPRAIEVMQRLAPDAPAYVAFDAEVWTTRLDLAVTALELARAIEDATGRPAGFAVWDAHVEAEDEVSPKGIDDAIVAGIPVRLVDRAGFGAILAPTLGAWEQADAA